MAKDYLGELERELGEAGGLKKALDHAAEQAQAAEVAAPARQPEQQVVASPEARKSLEKFRIKLVKRAEIIIKELLEQGILDPGAPLSELPARLEAYREELMKGGK